jgi:hypothetical protein
MSESSSCRRVENTKSRKWMLVSRWIERWYQQLPHIEAVLAPVRYQKKKCSRRHKGLSISLEPALASGGISDFRMSKLSFHLRDTDKVFEMEIGISLGGDIGNFDVTQTHQCQLSSFVHQTSAYTEDAYTLPYLLLTHLIYQVTNLDCGEEPSDITIIITFSLLCSSSAPIRISEQGTRHNNKAAQVAAQPAEVIVQRGFQGSQSKHDSVSILPNRLISFFCSKRRHLHRLASQQKCRMA